MQAYIDSSWNDSEAECKWRRQKTWSKELDKYGGRPTVFHVDPADMTFAVNQVCKFMHAPRPILTVERI